MDAIQAVNNPIQTADAKGVQAPIAEEVNRFEQVMKNQPLLRNPAVADPRELKRIDSLLDKFERGELSEQEVQELDGAMEAITANLEQQVRLRAVSMQIAVINTLITTNLVNGALFSADMLSSSILSDPYEEIY